MSTTKIKYNGLNFTTTRKKEIASRRKWPWLYNKETDCVQKFDAIAPGWKRAYVHEIIGAQDSKGMSPDLVYELPGRIFVRGWDYTGAITRRENKKTKR